MAVPKTITESAVDNYCASVESLLTAIAQRPMTINQMDRLAVILQRAERALLARPTISLVVDQDDADVDAFIG